MKSGFLQPVLHGHLQRRDGKRIKWLVNINVLLYGEDMKTGIRYCKNISFIWIQRKDLWLPAGEGLGLADVSYYIYRIDIQPGPTV